MIRENAEKLGRHLANLSLEYNQEHFDMSAWFAHNGIWLEEGAEIKKTIQSHFCGTVACAAGHIPIVFPELFEEHLLESRCGRVSWSRLIDQVIAPTVCQYSFFFSGAWSGADNPFYRTSWAAADRIAFVLQGGDVEYITFDEIQLLPTELCSVRAGWIPFDRYTKQYNAVSPDPLPVD